MKVLVVDDSGVMRKIIVRCLASLEINETVEAGDGKQGWEAFQATPYDVVITDWNMPEMNGLELVTAIRESGSTVPVIMVTTEGEKGKVVEAIRAGVNDYLCKPFERDELREKLERFVTV